MLLRALCCVLLVAVLPSAMPAFAGPRVLTPTMHHLRQGSVREWNDFPLEAEGDQLRLEFDLDQAPLDAVLRLRQRDVKQAWEVTLQGQPVGRLRQDENDIVSFLALPRGALRTGANTLLVRSAGKLTDDIEVGDIRLFDQPLEQGLSEAQLDIAVSDAATSAGLPCRLTIVDEHGSLMTLGAKSTERLAVRPGVIYSSDGRASFSLPVGKYTLYAGRGFEYSVASTRLELRHGERAERQLTIRREVPTPGLVSCDTHCHTFTYSRHGDASLAERLVTLAGEGVELPVATDHNLAIDYRPAMREAGLNHFFTPIVGDEVTTRVGHFNVFPLAAGSAPIEFGGRDWATVFSSIHLAVPKAMIVLNHARDIHSGFRPFDPQRHISIAGEDLAGWKLEANAMEIVNSGALRNDPLELVRDWFGLLNRGLHVCPIGSSDSHDVARFIVGQGRTYIQCADDDPGSIDTAAACRNLAAGRVSVSLGLLAEIVVNDQYLPGDLAPTPDRCQVKVRVLGPSWTQADRVVLYVNGTEVQSTTIAADDPRRAVGGVKWQATWTLDDVPHDAWLVAVALGPGITAPYWPTARPYQPSSPEWTPYVLAVTGAVRLDRDGDGKFTGAYDYAQQAIERAGSDRSKLLKELAAYDEAASTQAASLLRHGGVDLMSAEMNSQLRQAAPVVERGFRAYREAWRASLDAQATSEPMQ
jgi:hypothetical protein